MADFIHTFNWAWPILVLPPYIQEPGGHSDFYLVSWAGDKQNRTKPRRPRTRQKTKTKQSKQKKQVSNTTPWMGVHVPCQVTLGLLDRILPETVPDWWRPLQTGACWSFSVIVHSNNPPTWKYALDPWSLETSSMYIPLEAILCSQRKGSMFKFFVRIFILLGPPS